MTAPDIVLDKADPGDDVAQRYYYQHCYAAINAIRLITDERNVVEIICENHEDILVKRALGNFVGMQIKTRALGQPPFKSSDAQIKSALVKFCILDKQFPNAFDAFDFTTNHTFWSDADTTNNLPWLLRELRERGSVKGLRGTNPVRQFVDQISQAAELTTADVCGTLLKTILRGHESDISSIRGHVREVLSECPGIQDLPYLMVIQIADAIIGLARSASSKALKGPIADLYAPGADLAKSLQDQQLSGKRISRVDVVAIIDQFKSAGAVYQDISLAGLITPRDVPFDLIRAVRKLARGGVEASRTTNIEDLVRSFEALFVQWSRKYGVEEATKRYENVLAVVQFEATEAQVEAARGVEPYGSTMYVGLSSRLQNRARADGDQVYNCRPEHLLGAAGLLTEQCKTWWSSRFDVDGGGA